MHSSKVNVQYTKAQCSGTSVCMRNMTKNFFKRSRAYVRWKEPQLVNIIYSNANSRLKVQCSVASLQVR